MRSSMLFSDDGNQPHTEMEEGTPEEVIQLIYNITVLHGMFMFMI